MNVLVLGGYGLIGDVLVERLVRDGHRVSGLGRNVDRAKLRRPFVSWQSADMNALLSPDRWAPLLAGIDVVVNCAGALQDGGRDDLDAVHHRSVAALVKASEEAGIQGFVQISAAGAGTSHGAFFTTKASGDECLARSALRWTIFRPGLVIAPAAFGGSALLRSLAAFPYLIPVVMRERTIQTVSVFDVAEAVSRAVAGQVPPCLKLDLVEDKARSLGDILLALRTWLGLGHAPLVFLPAVFGRVAGAIADVLGRFGWRSPFRSSALAALAQGVRGDASAWRNVSGAPLRPLESTLADMPAHVQERWFARLWLLKPIAIACLSLFWIVSGLIGLVRVEAAADILASRGFGTELATRAVLVGGTADLAVGAAVLVRRYARPALLGMIAITLAYLLSASFFAPDLWLDPLGPLVKTIPALVLTLVALAVLDER